MRIRFLEKTFVGTGGNVFPGDEREIEDGMAQRLIARGIAEEAKKRGRKKKMSLSDRAVDAEELEIPEAD
jgi:hypothetical protein